MSRPTISTFQVFQMFPDAENARVYLERRRWRGHVVCPHCGCDERITARKGKRLGYYRCRDCGDEFTVRTGTVFERSHVPIHKWLYAMYLVFTTRKGISSMQLAKEIGVTQKTAWFMRDRLRNACGIAPELLSGVVRVDEAFISGKERNKHDDRTLRAGGGAVGKQVVHGSREGNRRSIAKLIGGTDNRTCHKSRESRLEPASKLHKAERAGYGGVHGFCDRQANDGREEHMAADKIHRKSVKSMWALLKRGLCGTWHLHPYVSKATLRLNRANCRVHTLDRLASFSSRSFLRRCTSEELTT